MTAPIRIDCTEPRMEVTDKEVDELLDLYSPDDPDLTRRQVHIMRLAFAVKEARTKPRTTIVQITDEWFDGDHPNPLHPKGVRMDPVKRVVHLGDINAFVGDWLVTDADGNRFVAFAA